MPHHSTRRGPATLFRTAFAVLLFVLVLPVLMSAAEGRKQTFDIPAGDAKESLKQFAAQVPEQLLASDAATRGVRTNAVRGEMTPGEALDTMLANTGLAADYDATTRAFAIRKESSAEAKNVARAIAATSARPSGKSVTRTDDGALQIEQVDVTGSRIRTMVGDQSIQPVLTITSREIDHMGVSSLGDVFRYIPQVSSSSPGYLVQAPTTFGGPQAGVASTRVTATLRGAPAGGTLLLVNGRRVPKNGQESGADAYDLSGVPLDAVDRIDVLLDGASAIYGADAVGGVINVILKKHYRGTELHLNYENTFLRDAGIKTGTLTHGFAAGKLSGSLTASWEQANDMMWRDRWFLKTFDRRAFGGRDNRDTASSGTGSVRATSGTLPGVGRTVAYIPAGSDGHSTVQDFASQPAPRPADYGDNSQYSTPYRRRSLLGSLEYEIRPWLSVFGDARYNESRTWSTNTFGYVATNISLPANAPGNPFGVPVVLTKIFWDEPAPQRISLTKNTAFTSGVRGELPGDWRFESTASLARTRPNLVVVGSTLNNARVAAAFASANPPVLLYDSTAGIPRNPPGALAALTVGNAAAERSDTWTYEAHADGALFTLPSGDIRMALGTEYREEYVDFPLQTPTSTNPHGRNRYTSGYFAEVNVPLISEAQHWLLLNRLEARVAARHDRYTDFPSTTNPSYGALYRPVKWLMFRGSYGEGYKVPTLSQLYSGSVAGEDGFAPGNPAFLDPLRGYEPVPEDPDFGLPMTSQGNPHLRPERSKNTTFGLVLEVPGVKGLSFSAGYFDTKYVDRAGSIPLTDRILLFPDTVQRGPRLPGDPPGWPGPVISYDDSPINIAFERVSGYDAALKYSAATVYGDFTFNAAVSRTTRREVRSTPNTAPTILSTPDTLPLQSSGSAFWTTGPWDIGVLYTYRADYRLSTTFSPTPSALRWDTQMSYAFSRAPWLSSQNRWLARILRDTRLGVTIFNVFDTVPPFSSSTLPDNTVLDSRLRRYAISLTKQF